MIGRRELAAGAAALALAGLGRRAFAQAPTPIRTQLGWIANVEYGGIWLGLERGYFKANGIDLSYAPGGPNAPQALVVIASGAAEFGFASWLPFLDAVAKGNKFVIVGAEFARDPLGVISLPKRPIRTAKDLVGAKILAQGSTEETTIDATLALAKLPREWKMIPTGFSPEPLLAGDADGYTAFETNQTITLEHMGMKRDKDFFFVSFYDLGFKTPTDLIVTTRELLDTKRPAVLGFLRALAHGWKDAAAEPATSAKLAVEKYGVDFGLDLAQQTREAELFVPLLRSSPAQHDLLVMDRDLVTGPMYDAARASGRTNLPNVDAIIDFKIAAEANQGL